MKKAPEGISKASCVITGILGGKAHFVACVRSNLVHEQRMNKEIELREDLSPRKYASYSLVPPIVWSGHLYEHVTCLRIMQQPSGSVHYTNPPN